MQTEQKKWKIQKEKNVGKEVEKKQDNCFFFSYFKKKKKEREEKRREEELLMAESSKDKMELFYESRKTVKELCAPLGVNPNPLEYMEIEDNGEILYTMCFYIHKLPKNSTFAKTYAPIFNFPNVTTTVFIHPMQDGESSKQLDKRIISLDSERIAAEHDSNRNKHRKISAKMEDAEKFARDVESGDNSLFEVSFLFVLQAKSLDELRLITSDFHMRGRQKGIELCSCYCVHPEAFLSAYPTNTIYRAEMGLVRELPIKKHIFDKGALLDIFNHTRSNFSHTKGIVAGHNLHTGQPVTIDVYDPSHNGFGVVITGMTGTGKSATMKMWLSRYADFDYYIRSIDCDARGNRGEYSMMTEALGGVNFQICPESTQILNLFEVDEESLFDEITGTEYKVLQLSAKKMDILNILCTMIRNGREDRDLSNSIAMERILMDAINDCFEEVGIVDGIVDSLYEIGTAIQNGKLTSGRVKKMLPTMTMLYKRILIKHRQNNISYYEKPYRMILDGLCDWISELIYEEDTLTFYTREEYNTLPMNEAKKRISPKTGKEIMIIHGTKAYFDGQSSIRVSQDTKAINIDISGLPESERKIGMLVALNYMKENHVKKNSIHPRKMRKMVIFIDELHKIFEFPEARKFVEDFYRTARKRNVSPWVATQALADFDGWKETKAIVKNSAMKLLFKQDFLDRDYIKKATPLSDSQLDEVLSLGGDPDDPKESVERKGEVCVIDNNKVIFLKVDYLTKSEAMFVETDATKIAKMYQGGIS